MPWDSFLLFVAATLALNVTPGPDMLYVTGRSVSDGLRGGVIASFGIAGGLLLHVAALAAGIATLLAANPRAYSAVRIAGSLYLIWLGIDAFRRTGSTKPGRPRAPDARAIFVQGALTAALNPKVALFFLALLPQFTDPARGNTVLQLVVLGLWFVFSGTLVNLVVAVAASRSAKPLRDDGGDGKAGVRLQRVTGVLFILLGARMAFAGR